MGREAPVHHELRYAVRRLLKSPGFTLVAVLGLGLGIGANVALFSVVHSIFLRPLPYHEPDRLVRLASTDEAQNLRRIGFSYPRLLEVQERQQVFSDLAYSAGNAFTLTGRGDPEQVIALHATASLLPALGLQPVLGRNFSASEDRPGRRAGRPHQPRFWQERFNGDPCGARTGTHARRRALHRHRRVAGSGVGVPAERASGLGAAPRRSAVPGARAAGQRRLLLPGHRTAAARRLGRTGPRRDGRHRRGLSRLSSGQRRCALDDRGRTAPRGCGG